MRTEFLALLAALHGNDVEFVVVGGVAAVIEGAIVYTADLDIVYATDAPGWGFSDVLDRSRNALEMREKRKAGE